MITAKLSLGLSEPEDVLPHHLARQVEAAVDRACFVPHMVFVTLSRRSKRALQHAADMYRFRTHVESRRPVRLTRTPIASSVTLSQII